MPLMTVVAATVWVLSLYNVFGQRQATYTDKFPDQNSCELARIQKGYAKINILGVHGKCEEAITVGDKLQIVKHKASHHKL